MTSLALAYPIAVMLTVEQMRKSGQWHPAPAWKRHKYLGGADTSASPALRCIRGRCRTRVAAERRRWSPDASKMLHVVTALLAGAKPRLQTASCKPSWLKAERGLLHFPHPNTVPFSFAAVLVVQLSDTPAIVACSEVNVAFPALPVCGRNVGLGVLFASRLLVPYAAGPEGRCSTNSSMFPIVVAR